MDTPLKLETRCLSSLSKVFADGDLPDAAFASSEAFLNEAFAFQIAYRANRRQKKLRLSLESALAPYITIRTVGLVPSELPIYEDHDDNLLRTTPGLYPDALLPYDNNDGLSVAAGQWRALWISVEAATGGKSLASEEAVMPSPRPSPGTYAITVTFRTDDGETLGSETFQLTLLAGALPEQTLIHTEWFHADCLATWYGDEPLDEAHWMRMGQYIETAVKHGMNMMLTPLFTPPLDTDVGGERPTVQLVDVEKVGDMYRFGFDKLERWIHLCQSLGVRYFEFSHLFTQWGAKHAPKIIALEDGVPRRIFGWETDAAGPEYISFLDQFLPALVDFVKSRQLEDRCYFHVSDEPHLEHMESYRSACAAIRRHVGEFPIIDALSNYSFYETGLVQRPIPGSNHIEPFLEGGVPELWTYYCCSQYKDVSNRFFAMPSARNRIIGVQLYKFRIAGFLHWGYNFWYSQFSRRRIDPFRVTDADLGFPSGDAFLVYPGEDGPIESIRLEVFHEALQDMRALQWLESLVGRERVLSIIEEDVPEPITFSQYPRDAEWLHNLRRKVNAAILSSQGQV